MDYLKYATLKEKSYYENLKKEIVKTGGVAWKKIAGRPYIGNCSYLFKKLKPVNYQDFFNKYIKFLPIIRDDSLKKYEFYGRSIEDLFRLAKKYKELANDSTFTIEDYFDDIVNHIIIETFDGHIIEKYIADILIQKGYQVNEECGYVDAVLGVDIVAKWNNKIKSFIQIKPVTTFLGNNNQSLINDRINFYNKQKKLNEWVGYGNEKDIEYMIYDKSMFDENGEIMFYYIGDRCRFKLNELCDCNGMSLILKKNLILRKLIIK